MSSIERLKNDEGSSQKRKRDSKKDRKKSKEKRSDIGEKHEHESRNKGGTNLEDPEDDSLDDFLEKMLP